eukprot:Phypoly_transcript_17207.p1 GENE.Phypoly_transcript_17207~~Phypoly_transcript_17207.p1  ORF type:complete len:240 (+),score=26.45 Phypoly_transcript_17207:91-810(+)
MTQEEHTQLLSELLANPEYHDYQPLDTALQTISFKTLGDLVSATRQDFVKLFPVHMRGLASLFFIQVLNEVYPSVPRKQHFPYALRECLCLQRRFDESFLSGTLDCLPKLEFSHIKLVDLSRNKAISFYKIAPILQYFPNVEVIDLSYNIFEPVDWQMVMPLLERPTVKYIKVVGTEIGDALFLRYQKENMHKLVWARGQDAFSGYSAYPFSDPALSRLSLQVAREFYANNCSCPHLTD